MQVTLRDIGKRFHNKWVFRALEMDFDAGKHHAITGKNGSGKSTLLMICAGYLSPSKGNIQWYMKGKNLAPELIYPRVSLASPYLELVEEFTLEESIRFHRKFKAFLPEFQVRTLVELSGLKDSQHKPLRHFSSGMKQRVKLLLAIMSDTPLVLLDEPCANLDSEAIAWYQHLKKDYGQGRSFIICSNHNPQEYPEVNKVFSIP
ncbi:MAG: ATP-binding cassette domain-containing protein [Bacteroidales bacterium]|jgi:ABC-type multidrug transport system ATPase subunit|nr:ATP-binding cassette domain-containing protein [Bacteroidales bacterium]NLM92946.1 ATP-binding cassette domain-containing protein [Bacteroidales bacterium]